MEVIISPSQGQRFDSIVQNEPCVAKFHRPGCPYCVELEPIWKSLLQLPEIANLNTKMLNVHSGAIQNITSKCAENITGVPTIMIIYNHGTSRKLHKSANDLDSIVKFITDNKKLFGQNGGAKHKKSHRKKLNKQKRSRSRRILQYTKRNKNKKHRRMTNKRSTRKR